MENMCHDFFDDKSATGKTKLIAGEEESHCSDSEVSHGRTAFLPRVEGLGAMSRSCR